MIVSRKYRFIFLKTAKTGGTSTELALSPACGPDDILTPLNPGEERMRQGSPARNYAMGLGRLGIRLPGEIRHRFPRLSGYYHHMPARDVRRLVGEATWGSFYKFTIERNPWDRQVSMYFWRTRRLRPRPDFKTYLKSGGRLGARSARMKNWETYTIDDRIVVDRVIRFEALAEEFAEVWARLGIAGTPTLPSAKGRTRDRGAGYRELYDEETRTLVARWYAREIEAFGYEF